MEEIPPCFTKIKVSFNEKVLAQENTYIINDSVRTRQNFLLVEMTSKYSTSKKVNFPNAKDNYQLLCTVSRRKGTQLLMRVTIMPVHLNHFLWVKKTTSKKSMVGFRYWHLASRISHLAWVWKKNLPHQQFCSDSPKLLIRSTLH